MFLNECHNRVDQLLDATESASTQPLVGDFTEPTLDQIQPGTAGGNEMHVKPPMPFQPRFDLGMLVHRMGRGFSGRLMIRGAISSRVFARRPPRGASFSMPAKRPSANRVRHSETVFGAVFNFWAISRFIMP